MDLFHCHYPSTVLLYLIIIRGKALNCMDNIPREYTQHWTDTSVICHEETLQGIIYPSIALEGLKYAASRITECIPKL